MAQPPRRGAEGVLMEGGRGDSPQTRPVGEGNHQASLSGTQARAQLAIPAHHAMTLGYKVLKR